MAKKQLTTIGIEYDNFGIRGVKATGIPHGKGMQFSIEKLEHIKGNYVKDDHLIDGLRRIRDAMSPSMGDQVVSCVSGKQIYAAHIPFRRLPDEEMRNVLRYEIRKNLPFEIAGSTIEYQYLSSGEKKGENTDVLVTAVANILLDRHLKSLEKAGLKPHIVDVIPLGVANAFWASRINDAPQGPHIILHIGPEICTLVIDGEDTSFYHRTIYFTARDLYESGNEEEITSRERERRIVGFTDELVRSLSFYESNFHTTSFSVIHLLGTYCHPDLVKVLEEKTGLHTAKLNLIQTINPEIKAEESTFELAAALAMRVE